MNVNVTDEFKQTPLSYAAKYSPECTDILLRHENISVNFEDELNLSGMFCVSHNFWFVLNQLTQLDSFSFETDSK